MSGNIEQIYVPTNEDALKNSVWMNISEMLSLHSYSDPEKNSEYDPEKTYYVIIGDCVINLINDPKMLVQQIMMPKHFREQFNVAQTDNLFIFSGNYVDINCISATVHITNMLQRNISPVDENKISTMIRDFLISNKMFITEKQILLFKYEDAYFSAKFYNVKARINMDVYKHKSFVITQNTIFNMTSDNVQLNKLNQRVHLGEIAQVTHNLTGSELKGLVKSAISHAITRTTTFDNHDEKDQSPKVPTIDEDAIIITKNDLELALSEIAPNFGPEIAKHISKYKIINYSKQFESFYETMQNYLQNFIKSKNSSVTIFLSGIPGSGKTNLALNLALKTQFPFISYISNAAMIGMTYLQKTNYIKECFDKPGQSVIVFDDVENIINLTLHESYTFSSSLCTDINSLVKSPVSQFSKKRIIICTFDWKNIDIIVQSKILFAPHKTYEIPQSRIDEHTSEIIREINKNEMDDEFQDDGLQRDGLQYNYNVSIKNFIFAVNNQ